MAARLTLLAAVFAIVQTAIPVTVPLTLLLVWGVLTIAAIYRGTVRR